MIDYVEVEIGGQRIDRQYGQFMHLWNQLTMTAGAGAWLPQNDWADHPAYLLD